MGEYRNNRLMGGLVAGWWKYHPKRARALVTKEWPPQRVQPSIPGVPTPGESSGESPSRNSRQRIPQESCRVTGTCFCPVGSVPSAEEPKNKAPPGRRVHELDLKSPSRTCLYAGDHESSDGSPGIHRPLWKRRQVEQHTMTS